MRLHRSIYILGLLTCVVGRAAAEPPVVFLNELQIQGRERVEVFNSLHAPKSIAGWRLITNLGMYAFPSGTVVPALGYRVVDLEGLLDDLGGEIAFIDIQGDLQDRVSWGQQGSAPLPPTALLFLGSDVSLARAPDARATTPPASTPETDGLYWNIDSTPTFGAMNDAPEQKVGTSVVINELSLSPDVDVVELYNPLTVAVAVTAWHLTNGISSQTLTGVVPPLGYLVIGLSPAVDIDDSQLIYLYDRDWVRLDQLGLLDAPTASGSARGGAAEEECYARIPDGAGPNLGFDWRSSGGDVTLFLLRCTLGGSNNPVSGIPEMPDETETWGALKARWQHRP